MCVGCFYPGQQGQGEGGLWLGLHFNREKDWCEGWWLWKFHHCPACGLDLRGYYSFCKFPTVSPGGRKWTEAMDKNWPWDVAARCHGPPQARPGTSFPVHGALPAIIRVMSDSSTERLFSSRPDIRHVVFSFSSWGFVFILLSLS